MKCPSADLMSIMKREMSSIMEENATPADMSGVR